MAGKVTRLPTRTLLAVLVKIRATNNGPRVTVTNAPRNKGTRAESAAAKWLTDETGYPVVRAPLSGNADKGDLTGLPGPTCIEVKNTKIPSFSKWGKELMTEKRNSNSAFGVVLWSPPGVGMAHVEDWIAITYGSWNVSMRVVPHIGPMSSVHKYVAEMSRWGYITQIGEGNTHAQTVSRWLERWRERVQPLHSHG